KWKAAMEEEMDSLRKNKTWELVDHPARKKLVSCKWLVKIKEGIEGVQKPRYKARLVARGFIQRACTDYNKVFFPVVQHTSIQVILALTACKDYELEQLDVKTAFLHGNLEEVIYMRQPPGYEQGNKVCLLKKSFYGLKQLPRQWYRRFDEYMLSNGFKRSSYDSCELREAKKILGMEIIRDQSRKILKVSHTDIREAELVLAFVSGGKIAWGHGLVNPGMLSYYECFLLSVSLKRPAPSHSYRGMTMDKLPDDMIDINDPAPEDGLSMQDVQALTERVIDLRPIPSSLLFQGGLATTWDSPGFRPIFKDTKGNGNVLVEVEDPKIVVTRERKARAAAKKRESMKQGGDGGEGSQPKTKRRKTAAESREDRSPHASPRDSANHLVHSYFDDHRDEETYDLNLGSFGGRSSREEALYVLGWSIHRRCRVDIPMWCRELMVHLAPPVAQEESNALNNATALERAWFSLASGSLAQTDILERFESLQTDFDRLAESHAECGDLARKLVQARLDLTHSSHLYTSLSDRHKAFKNEHEGCARKLKGLENRNRELSQANRDQVLRIKEFKDVLAQKDSTLVYAKMINTEQAQQKEKLVS
nr:retrovirus-related Pol polyprotein from transposon TNT 1-94 [Tanacetum cinerariifolium]